MVREREGGKEKGGSKSKIKTTKKIIPIFFLPRAVATHLLRKRADPPAPAAPVEWLYALDTHVNSFLPCVLELYCLHVALAPALLRPGRLACLLSCALWAAAIAHYHFLTFLGYAALDGGAAGVDRGRCALLLWPAVGAALAVPAAVVAGFNPSRVALGWYFGG